MAPPPTDSSLDDLPSSDAGAATGALATGVDAALLATASAEEAGVDCSIAPLADAPLAAEPISNIVIEVKLDAERKAATFAAFRGALESVTLDLFWKFAPHDANSWS